MIGNDIVDLTAAATESNWRRRGFLQKLFTAEERDEILASANPEVVVWLLWSMKEAAYKAHQRQYNLGRSYQPKSFSATINSFEETSASGKIQCGENVYLTRSTIGNRYIHTTASSSEEKECISKILPSSENLKSAFISHCARIKNYSESLIDIKKDRRFIPLLTYKGRILELPFSFSHHSRFSAYTLSLMNY